MKQTKKKMVWLAAIFIDGTAIVGPDVSVVH